MTGQSKVATRSQLERDLAQTIKAGDDRRVFFQNMMELMSAMEGNKLVFTSYPACNSDP